MSSSVHLAVDLGAESGRAMLGALDGDRLAIEEAHRFPNRTCRLPDGLHWDLPGLWRELQEGLGRAATRASARGVGIDSIGVDTWGVDFGLLDASGGLLGLPRCYRDERNRAVFARLMADPGADALYAATGIQCMDLNTLVQLAAQVEADRSILDAADRLLFMPDLLHWFLTGEAVVEASIASTSQMIDPRTGTWATALLESLDLPTGILGPIAPAGSRVGPLLAHVTEATGADAAGAPMVIAPAAHDTASAVAAVPASDGERWCFLSSGTWSLLGAELDAPCVSREAQAAPFTNERGVGDAILFLKNITGLWLVQELRRDLARAGSDHDYARLVDMAAEATPFRMLLDPDDPPFAEPGRMGEKMEAFATRTGQPAPVDAGSLVRACLESLALAYRRTLEQLESVLGRRFDVVHVVGGGARNRLLDQMIADATGRRVVAGPVEATAIGNVLVQAMGLGIVRDAHHARRIVAASFEVETFEPRDPAAWDARAAQFDEIIRRGRE